MDKTKKRLILIISIAMALAAITIGALLLHQQRERNVIMEQERQNELRMQNLHSLLNRISLGHYREMPIEGPLETSQAIISLTYLRHLGFSQEDVIEIWIEREEREDDYNVIRGVLSRSHGGLTEFEGVLGSIYVENFEVFEGEFSDLNLSRGIQMRDLPLPVLEKVINLWEKQNAQN